MIRWADKHKLMINAAYFTEDMLQSESDWNCVADCSVVLPELVHICAIPQLCRRISAVNVPYHAIGDDSPPDPATSIRNLRKLSTCPANCAEGWMLALVEANAASLETLTIDIGNDEDIELPAGWLANFLLRCSNVVELKIVMPFSESRMLHDIAQNCPALRHLCVQCSQDDWEEDDEELSAGAVLLAKSCVHLTKLDLEFRMLQPAAIREVILLGRNITDMQICGANYPGADLLLFMSPARAPLTVLEMTWSLSRESEVHACAALFRSLRELAVTVLPQCTSTFLAAIPYLSELRSLDLDLDDPTEEEELQVCLAVGEHCRKLTKLFMTQEHTNLTIGSVETILRNNRFMDTIEIICADGSDALLSIIGANCPLLTSLIADTRDATDIGIAAVARGCKHLTILQVKGGTYTAASLQAITQHGRRLVELGLPAEVLADLLPLAEFIRACPALETLTITISPQTRSDVLLAIAPREVVFFEGYGEF
jgi:hypothetical protein